MSNQFIENRQRNARLLISEFRGRNNLYGIGVVCFDLLIYAGCFVVGALAPELIVKLVCGAVCGIFTARLFVLGHDGCHQSLTSIRLLNRWVARVAFLPSITPYSSWELAHNSTHHPFCNWAEKDYVWAPLSKLEFDCLPVWRMLLERVYRSPLGHGLYYLVEIWWKRLYFPRSRFVSNSRRYVPGSIAVSVFLVLELTFLVMAGDAAAGSTSIQIATMLLLPFMVWICLMGFTVFLHHSHPDVPWFRSREEWNASNSQLKGTVHVEFSVPFDAFFHHIYRHTAHHLDVGIPFYHLKAAQKKLEREQPEDIVIEPLTVQRFLATTRSCKLYDYENHCWLGFDGVVTARTKYAETLRTNTGAV